MQRPTRRSRLGIVASLVTIVATTVLTASPTVLASEPGTEGASGGALTRLPNVHSGSRGSIDVSKLAGSANSVSNSAALRGTSIGSTKAWLPSRRSTLHQIGALTIRRSGQRRSGSGTATYG